MIESTKGDVKWERRNKKIIVRAMGECCQNPACGYSKSFEALELHHLDPKKKDPSFRMTRISPINFGKLAGEAEKCILLCANCHREVHAGILLVPTTFTSFNRELVLEERNLRINIKKQVNFAVNIIRENLFLTPSEVRSLLYEEFDGNIPDLTRYLRVTERALVSRLNQISFLNY